MLSQLGHSSAARGIVRLELLIRLDLLVVGASLVLRHQQVILLALLFSLNLLVERREVLLFGLLPALDIFTLPVVKHLVLTCDLVGKDHFILAHELLLLLFLLHLGQERLAGLVLVFGVKVSLSLLF